MSTKPKILLIQFRKNEAALRQEQQCIEREIGAHIELEYIAALNDEIRWDAPEKMLEEIDGVILGGSGDFDFDGNRPENDENRSISYTFLEKLRPLFQYIFDNDLPTLGICYGHQLLGAFAGAQVVFDEAQKKTKSHELKLLVDKNDYFLFSDLPDSFFAHYGHKDALDRVPDGAVLLMSGGDGCRVSALKYKNNIYTTQFHPELSYEDMVERMKNTPGYLPEGVIASEIFKDDPHTNTILRNFSKFVSEHAFSQPAQQLEEQEEGGATSLATA